jgi:DNA-binding winged helix-turn-helix (wHTH) protein/tetratricopeptide (TPR) repeat protein
MNSGLKGASRIRFSDFTFDLDTGELRKNDILVRLPPQPSKVLAVLTSHAGELVTREELEETVWGKGTVVDFERGLNSCVNQIRHALGDHSERPQYVETLPRRGYRFLPPVETLEPEQPLETPAKYESPLSVQEARRPFFGPRRTLLLVAVVASVLLVGLILGLSVRDLRERLFGASETQHISSLVALPTKVLGLKEDEFLADAIPNTISNFLAQVPGLETKVPPSSTELDRFGGDLARIADAYQVNAFILSTLTAQSGELLLNVQLVELPSRRLRWSREYEGPRHAYLEFVRRAAEDLRVELGTAPVSVNANLGVSASSESELAYLRGLYYASRYNHLHQRQDLDLALAAFQRAMQLDLALADAAAEIAWLFEFKMEAGDDPQEARPQMYAWARHALEIDPENGRAWALLNVLEAERGEATIRRLLVNGLRAVNSAPRFPRSHIALAQGLASSRLRLEANHQAARLDPLYLYPPLLASLHLAWLHRTGEALSGLDRVLSIEPDMPFAHMVKALVLMREGRMEEAASLMERLEPMAADGRLNAGWFAGLQDLSIVLQGKSQDAEAALQRLLQVASGQSPLLHRHAWVGAWTVWLAGHGKVHAAGQLLLAQDRSGWTLPYDMIRLSPDFHWLRRDPKYEGIVQRSRAQFEEVVAILDEARSHGELPSYLEKPLADLRAELGL